eukprot:gene30352-35357_t
MAKFQSGGGVLGIAAAQLVVGLCLLGIYEGYKAYYFNSFIGSEEEDTGATERGSRTSTYESPLDFRSPMGFSYWLAIVNNIFAVFGLAGILTAQRGLIIAFFGYNAAQMVVAFHTFVDLCTDTKISYKGEPGKLTAYEQATTAFMFFSFVLSVAATVFGVRAIDEMKQKQREEYNRFSVLSDTLQFEADQA